ncbi:spore germination protein GerPC [Alkalihalobacterium alkalinitrilicum]|uniref:spore germination protein GerPC n=1 Tax=Alkalihalobacterium alkalinitrilicum TaxID=427920 RepID=UPI000A8FF3A9|nr:spore germination protein GerPC [Alkalihalobacterium alkalinitrilicum]
MYNNWNYGSYFDKVNGYLQAQNERILQLEQQLMQMREELTQLKQSPPGNNIDRIEYKFDQLKIERLEGTLNIGLTPNGGTSPIEDFNVNQNELSVSAFAHMHPETVQAIQHQIYHYLDHECHPLIQSLEQKHNYQMDPPYRNFIIGDVKKQIDQRIHHYLNQVQGNQYDVKQVEQMTVNKVKEDIGNTFDAFIRHLPREENPPT